MKGFLKIVCFSLLILTAQFCDAPRTNPLDPESPDNILATISGSVETVSIPRTPIQSVNVFWKNRSTLVTTNSNGTFQIEDIEKVDGYIYFEKTGYSTDSIFINWAGHNNVHVNSFLNANPVIEELTLSSTTIYKHPVLIDYFVNVKTKLSDEENDIDSVFLQCAELNIFKPLGYNVPAGSFEGDFHSDSLQLSSIDQTVGKDFFLIVKDNNGKYFNAGGSNIKRIIKQEIEYDSPSNFEPVTIPFRLEWTRYLPGFPFLFSLQIFSNEGSRELVWEKVNLSPDLIFFEVTDTLPAGEYYWVIWCYDEFNNAARSKPATFVIQ